MMYLSKNKTGLINTSVDYYLKFSVFVVMIQMMTVILRKKIRNSNNKKTGTIRYRETYFPEIK